MVGGGFWGVEDGWEWFVGGFLVLVWGRLVVVGG